MDDIHELTPEARQSGRAYTGALATVRAEAGHGAVGAQHVGRFGAGLRLLIYTARLQGLALQIDLFGPVALLLVFNMRHTHMGALCALSCRCPLNLGGSLESSAHHSIRCCSLRATKASRPAPLWSTFCLVDHLRLYLTQGGQELIHGVVILARSCAVELTTDLGLVEVVLSGIGGAKRLELWGSPRKAPTSAHQVLEVGILATGWDLFLGDSCGSSRSELAEMCSIHGGLV